MKITEQEVRYVAGLANLKLTDAEIHRLSHDLDEILTHVDALNEVDTSQVEPMAQVVFNTNVYDSDIYDSDETATLRADVERPPLGTEAALANAPLSGAGYFKVPRVIER